MKTSEELRKQFTNETDEDWHEDEAVSINPEYLNWLETKVGQNETIVMSKDKEIEASKLTRITVVEKEVGRVIERWNVEINIYVQDEGRTLKIIYG